MSYDGPVKAITLWQPYASYVVWGVKTIETRSRVTKHRGPLIIHAAKMYDNDAEVLPLAERDIEPEDLPMGAVVGRVNVVACLKAEECRTLDDFYLQDPYCDFSDGRYGWVLDFPVEIDPIPAQGQQNVWHTSLALAEETDRRVRHRLGQGFY